MMSEHIVIAKTRKAIAEAWRPKGMSTHDGKVTIDASHADWLLKEIDRLKADLEEASTIANDNYNIILALRVQLAEANDKFIRCNEARIQAQKESEHNKRMWDGSARRVTLLESQLAEARADVEKLSFLVNRSTVDLLNEARQEAAREILNEIENWGEIPSVNFRNIRQRYGLEG